MYSYGYSRASPKPQIEGPSNLRKMSALPKAEDKIGPSMLSTRVAPLVTLC